MMTYSFLGNNGKLGNQMFQYATLFAQAKERGVPFAIPSEIYRDQYGFKLEGKYEILQAFPNISASLMSKQELTKINASQDGQYREPGFCYDPNISLVVPNVDLWGYFQSEKYFSKFRDGLLKEFSFEAHVDEAAVSMVDKVKKSLGCQKLCAVHLRRGDYLGLSDVHTNLDANYYNASLGHISNAFEDIGFLVFSDDIEWCKKSMPSAFAFSSGRNHLEDMKAISLCDAHIIANSSFSWWGAWLSNSECVIAPKKWFGPKGPSEWSTIYGEKWLVA